MTLTKTCSKCGKEKSILEFSRRKRSKDGYYTWCKECAKEYQAEWYLKNKENVNEKHRKYHREHLEKIRVHNREYCNRPEVKQRRAEYIKSNQEHIRKYQKMYRSKNKAYIREKQNEYYHKNKEKNKQWHKKWRDSHKEQIKESNKKYREENKEKINQSHVDRLHNDPIFKMKEQTRNMIRYVFRSKGHHKISHTVEILGCDLDFFCQYLLDTWERNYSKAWSGEPYHIDHIIPLATAKTKEDVVKLCHYTNLQMLTPENNMAKSDKV